MQERNRMSNEITEMKDHMDIKDRKINVLQRKVNMGQIKDELFVSFKNHKGNEQLRYLIRDVIFKNEIQVI